MNEYHKNKVIAELRELADEIERGELVLEGYQSNVAYPENEQTVELVIGWE